GARAGLCQGTYRSDFCGYELRSGGGDAKGTHRTAAHDGFFCGYADKDDVKSWIPTFAGMTSVFRFLKASAPLPNPAGTAVREPSCRAGCSWDEKSGSSAHWVKSGTPAAGRATPQCPPSP